MKRLLALLVAGFGIRALLRRGSAVAPEAPQAADLRAKLEEARAAAPPAEPRSDVDARRADVHERGRGAIDDMR